MLHPNDQSPILLPSAQYSAMAMLGAEPLQLTEPPFPSCLQWIPVKSQSIQPAATVGWKPGADVPHMLHPLAQRPVLAPTVRDPAMAAFRMEFLQFAEPPFPLRIFRIPVKSDSIQPPATVERTIVEPRPLVVDPIGQSPILPPSTLHPAMAVPVAKADQLKEPRQPGSVMPPEVEAQVIESPQALQGKAAPLMALQNHPFGERAVFVPVHGHPAVAKTTAKSAQLGEPLLPSVSFVSLHARPSTNLS
jgi:hypothetical protein